MQRTAFFIYGVTGHAIFLAVYAWLAGFVGNFLVPHSIDSQPTTPIPLAVAIDLGLIALFGLQHSIMARPAFKRVWTKIVPQPIERATYVYAANAVTILLMWQWQPINLVVWNVQQPAGRLLLQGLFAAGWLLVPAVTMMISHTDLFGTRQVWLYFRGREYTSLPFRTPMLYSKMRHPLYVGWAIAFWATPTMTAGHLLFAAGMTAYMLVAVVFEERDLISYFGRQYEDYRRRVPAFVPRFLTDAFGLRSVTCDRKTAQAEACPVNGADSACEVDCKRDEDDRRVTAESSPVPTVVPSRRIGCCPIPLSDAATRRRVTTTETRRVAGTGPK